MKHIANSIAGLRIVLSLAILFFPTFSPAFYVLYAAAGLTDMIDGTVARKTNTVSEFGSRLDTIADLVFVAVCLFKLLTVLTIPVWLWIWIAVIADPSAVDEGMVITKQPTTYWMRNDDQSETATFSIEAVKADTFLSTDNVRFFWQEYNEAEEEWDTVHITRARDTGEEQQVFKSSYTVAIEGDKKDDFFDKGVRCLVSCGNTTKTSDLVSFYYVNENCILLGDANGNDEVDIIDATLIQRYLANMNVPDTFSTNAADVDRDDDTTVKDVTLIQRWLADMGVKYPIGQYILIS